MNFLYPYAKGFKFRRIYNSSFDGGYAHAYFAYNETKGMALLLYETHVRAVSTFEIETTGEGTGEILKRAIAVCDAFKDANEKKAES